MEPSTKKNYVLIMIGFIAAVVVIMYTFSLRTQLQEARANQDNYEETIASLSSVQKTDALKVNRMFLNNFFTYQTTAERYKNIKSLMTDQGYKATHPSGTELPNSKQSVNSAMIGLKSFEYQSSRTEAEFFNEFKLSTEFNDVTNTETVIVKTSLIYVKRKGWKIDDIELVGQLTGRK
jgi:type II secretory pathway pseudopilin PulG